MVVKGINLELSKKEMAELASKLKKENIELKQQLAAAKQLNEMYKSALAADGKFDVKNEEFIVSEKSQINKIKLRYENNIVYII